MEARPRIEVELHGIHRERGRTSCRPNIPACRTESPGNSPARFPTNALGSRNGRSVVGEADEGELILVEN